MSKSQFPSRSHFSFTIGLLALTLPGYSLQVSLSGKITFADGNPVIGVTVAVPTTTGQRETQTDAIGNYSFSIDEGTYDQLRVRSMSSTTVGIPQMMEYVAVTPLVVVGNTVKNVTLPPIYKVQGALKSPAGAAVSGVRLMLQRWDGTMTQLPMDGVTTAGDGTFQLLCMGGQVKLSVPGSPDSSMASFQKIFTLSKDTLLDLAYPTAPILSGTVRTSEGNTLAGILVALVKDGVQSEKRTDATGKFSFVVSAGNVTALRIRTMNDTLSQVPAYLEYMAFENFPITAALEKDITLLKYPLLTGRLLGSDGAPLAGFKVGTTAWLSNMRQSPSDQAVTNASGHFALRCALGSNQMVIDPDSGSRYAKEIRNFTIASDSSPDIQLVKGAVVDGKVLFANNLPVAGIGVAFSNGLEQKETKTDASGNFRVILQPGKYSDFRIRSMIDKIPGIPRMLEHTVIPGGITVTDSSFQTVVLPPFPKMSGKVLDAGLLPVSGVSVSSTAWYNGMSQLPRDESFSGADGKYEIVMATGTNWITIKPSQGGNYASTAYTLKIDRSFSHDIILADQAKGIASVQPSVVGQGKSGKISLIGINTAFLQGVSAIEMGGGITITGITVHSDISITGQVQVSDTAMPGARSVRVISSKGTYVGAEAFTVTAPVSAAVAFDNDGKTTKTILIEDGTGTQLKVDSGTTVKLPPGAEKILGFEAPLIKNDQVNPKSAEFLQVQREFSPSGVFFDPPASLTFHYQDQDMKGVDESKLKAFKYDNKADTVVAEYKVLERDTAKNLLKQEVTTFSLFRLAKSTSAIGVREVHFTTASPMRLHGFKAIQESESRLRVSFSLHGIGTGKNLRFRLYDLSGGLLGELNLTSNMSVNQVAIWPFSVGSLPSGCYRILVEAEGVRQVQTVFLGL